MQAISPAEQDTESPRAKNLRALFLFWREGGTLIQTYRIIGSTLAISGVPGMWHAGQEVDVDTDTNKVLDVRLLPITPEDADTETSPQQTMTVHVSLDDKPFGTWTAAPRIDNLPVAVEEATEDIQEGDA